MGALVCGTWGWGGATSPLMTTCMMRAATGEETETTTKLHRLADQHVSMYKLVPLRGRYPSMSTADTAPWLGARLYSHATASTVA